MMYNGEIVGSYNIGEIRSTRKNVGQIEPLNMGGIVGDSTEETSAKSVYMMYIIKDKLVMKNLSIKVVMWVV